MIQSFKDSETKKILQGKFSKKLPTTIQRTARRKLIYLHSATELDELKSPPGNRLEPLSGNRKGQHSIRINDQWCVVFQWEEGNVFNVQVVDDH